MFYNNSYITDRRKIAYTYNVTTPAANLPLTLAEVKTHLRLDPDDTSEDSYLTILIETAADFGERYTGRDFINKTYTTFRNDFFEPLLLRRSKVSSITSIQYLINGVLTTVANTVYGLEDVNDYPYIYLKDNQEWPTDTDCIPQSIKIVFVSGYGASNVNIPSDIKLALLNHIAFLYENRGDCSGECGGAMLPANSKTIYDKRRIINIGSYEKPASYYRL
jgi:uncharacterized phiE125 gp8 family phage protein